MTRRFFLCVLFCISLSGILFGQTVQEDRTPEPYGKLEFPEWQQDLRRAEIISFGALPFVSFMASIYYDVYRYASHNGDEAYLPWPMKKADIAVPLSQAEQKNIFFTAAGISVGVAVFDFSYRALMRYIRESRARKMYNIDEETILIKAVDSTDE